MNKDIFNSMDYVMYSEMHEINYQKYFIYTVFKSPIDDFFHEVKCYQTADEGFLGVILLDKADSDYSIVILEKK